MKFLINGTMTLYYRSLWPIARKLIEDGHEVYFIKRGRFSVDSVRDNPTGVNILDNEALYFICKQSGYDKKYIDSIHWLKEPQILNYFRPQYRTILNKLLFRKNFDAYISTIKDFPWLEQRGSNNIPQIALPYQNILDGYSFRGRRDISLKLSNDVSYGHELRQKYPDQYEEIGLPYADPLIMKMKETKKGSQLSNKILFLHPGGWRNVITSKKDDKITCIEKQRKLYKKIINCLPEDKKMVLKIHPLAAKWHDAESNALLADELGFEIADGWLGDIIFDCDAILSLGSSSYFEIAGLNIPYYILGFLGGERAQYYQSLKGSYIEFEEVLSKKLLDTSHECSKNDDCYNKSLYDGRSTERALKLVYDEVNKKD